MKNKVKQLAAGIFLATVLVVGNANAKGTELNALIIKIYEAPAQMESWMTDDAFWNTETSNSVLIVQESESALEIESWMIRDNIWEINYQLLTETESGLELENWMIKEDIWN